MPRDVQFARPTPPETVQGTGQQADTLCMNIVLIWLAVAGAAVLLVAVTVAWLEQRRRAASRQPDRAWFDTDIDIAAP